MPATSSRVQVARAPGLVRYERACAVQREVAAARAAGDIGDVLLVLEHQPVYTRGRRSTPEELPMGEEWYRMQGIEVCDSDRGGWATYHGPGQLVVYPVVSLRDHDGGVVGHVRRMERAIGSALAEHGVGTQLIDGLAGVWTEGAAPLEPGAPGPQGTPVGAAAGAGRARKIASIGIHVSRGVTTHGLAVNVNNDLQPFEWIVPCAIDGVAMTSLCRELGAEQDLAAFADSLVSHLADELGAEPVRGDWAELGGPLALTP